MARRSNMARLEALIAAWPETSRVDVEAWDGEPTLRVRGKTFVFANPEATIVTVKLPREEAEAVVATVPGARPTGYGLGRSGWVTVSVPAGCPAAQWAEVEEWVRTSYCLVAPKTLARQVESHSGA